MAEAKASNKVYRSRAPKREPSARQPRTLKCLECAEPFTTLDPKARFCGSECEEAYAVRCPVCHEAVMDLGAHMALMHRPR